MNRKIFFTIFAIFVVTIGLSTVSAGLFDFADESSDNTTITLDGIDFNIPAGYEEDSDLEIVNETQTSGVEFVMNGKTFEKGNDFVSILVSNYGDLEVTDEIIESLGGNKTTINDVDGYLAFDGTYYTFSYPVDGKLAVLSAMDQDIFKDFVVA